LGILLVALVSTELLTALEIGEESDGKKEGCLRWVSASRPSKLLKGRAARWTRTILFLTFAEDTATRYHASQC
jgi:hypothetical protein